MYLREIFHDIETNGPQPLKKGDTIKVYHGFRDYNQALEVAKYGLSGATKVPRVYSYESDNNPKGLFVSSKFEPTKQFAAGYKLTVVMEFVADYSELEAPIWPGGSWTGYGGYSKYWGHGIEGRRNRNQARKELSKKYETPDEYTPEWVKLSDDPYKAELLMSGSEPQALFVGHLNPKRISAFYVREVKNQEYASDWTRMSREEFMEKYTEQMDKSYKSQHKYKVFNPDDDFDPEVFMKGLADTFPRSDVRKNLSYMWKYVMADKNKVQAFKDHFGQELWPKQMPAAFNWLKREFKNEGS